MAACIAPPRKHLFACSSAHLLQCVQVVLSRLLRLELACGHLGLEQLMHTEHFRARQCLRGNAQLHEHAARKLTFFGCTGLFRPAAATAVAAAVAAGGSTLLTVPLKMACGAVPQFTLAFNMATLSVLAFVRPLWEFSPPPDPSAVVGGITDWLCAPLVGVSQIFVVNDPIAGAMMLGAIGVYSPQCAALTLMGSAIGTGTGAVLGASHFDIANGLWGFNAALTSLAVGVFFVPKLEMYALAGSGAVASTLVFGGAKGIVAAGLGIPVCTLPFCAVASACMLTPRLGLVPGLLHAANPHSPEKNEAP